MWLTSQDDEFRSTRDDILHVYYDTPADEHIICLDEKTSIQALERRYADLPMMPGKPVRREFEYVRHGTLALMGAFDVRRGKLFGFVSEDHNALTFVDLLDVVDLCYPTGAGTSSATTSLRTTPMTSSTGSTRTLVGHATSRQSTPPG